MAVLKCCKLAALLEEFLLSLKTFSKRPFKKVFLSALIIFFAPILFLNIFLVISKIFYLPACFGTRERERKKNTKNKSDGSVAIQVNVRACSEGLDDFFLPPYLLMIQDLPKKLFVLLP